MIGISTLVCFCVIIAVYLVNCKFKEVPYDNFYDPLADRSTYFVD
jgi:hypothetical protein